MLIHLTATAGQTGWKTARVSRCTRYMDRCEYRKVAVFICVGHLITARSAYCAAAT